MRIHRILAGAVALTVAVACSDNPTGPDGHAEELTVELSFTPDHVHTLSPVTFQATVRDGHGDLVTDFDTLRVERLAEGSDTWRTAADLALVAGAWEGEYTFSSTGEYHLRVLGQRTGHAGMDEIPMADSLMEHMEVARAHVEVEGMRIEFESFPGHIHEGDDVTFRFWIKEAEPDASGVRPPLSGLEAEIRCGDPAGLETHVATESETGVYEAVHTFAEAGDASATIVVTTANGPAEASFDFHVVHAH